MAYVVMAYIVMAQIVMACIVMAYNTDFTDVGHITDSENFNTDEVTFTMAGCYASEHVLTFAYAAVSEGAFGMLTINGDWAHQLRVLFKPPDGCQPITPTSDTLNPPRFDRLRP